MATLVGQVQALLVAVVVGGVVLADVVQALKAVAVAVQAVQEFMAVAALAVRRYQAPIQNTQVG